MCIKLDEKYFRIYVNKFQTVFRFLFWLSGGSEIQRSDLSGQMKMTVLKLEEQLEALSVDRGDKRLFWVQLGLQGERAVASCDYSGNSLHIMDLPLQ